MTADYPDLKAQAVRNKALLKDLKDGKAITFTMALMTVAPNKTGWGVFIGHVHDRTTQLMIPDGAIKGDITIEKAGPLGPGTLKVRGVKAPNAQKALTEHLATLSQKKVVFK